VLPQAVSGNHQFFSLTSGPNTSCGLSTTEGVLCWGQALFDIHVTSTQPTMVETYYGSGVAAMGFRSFAVGTQFGCGVYIVGSWGENDCRGLDNKGQLGIDPTVPWMSKTISGTPYTNIFLLSSTGVDATGTPHVNRASAGAQYMCAEIMDGTVQCVGANGSGQLGNASNTSGSSSSPVTVSLNGNPMQLHGVTTGFDHACALDATNHVWCWGRGEYGQLGNGSTGFNLVARAPQPVSTTLTFTALAAGLRHTCGIATDNRVYCWGDNEYGQLGVGLNTLGMTPSGFKFATFIGTPRQVPAF
jgi:alpha-tubulin suppressor-like RCC1 family protein